jgi:DinB superfamily
MESAGLVLDALGRVRDMVRDALTDLSPEQLLAPPKPHIAWLVWHIARVQDANFSNLMDLPQLWIAGRWHERFNMPPDPRDYGSGHRHTQARVYSAHIFSPLVLSAKPKCHAAAVTIPEISIYLVLARVLFIPQWS